MIGIAFCLVEQFPAGRRIVHLDVAVYNAFFVLAGAAVRFCRYLAAGSCTAKCVQLQLFVSFALVQNTDLVSMITFSRE